MASTLALTFGLFDVTAKADSSPTTADKQPFVDTADLKLEDTPAIPRIATLEDNLFVLDGSYSLFPDTPQGQLWGWWSNSISGKDGRFTKPPALTVSFDEPHSSMGLTLQFDTATGDYPSHIRVTWVDGGGNIITAKEFHPDKEVYFANCKVENYRKVLLEVLATAKPYRYAKLGWIGYGIDMTFSGEDITVGTLLEELDPISSELSINTLNFSLHSSSADFSMLNPAGAFSLLQRRQAISTSQTVDGRQIPLGVFYLDEWTSDKENSATMTCVDWVGLLDKTSYVGGMFDSVTAAHLLADILSGTDAPYTLDAALQDVIVSGYLPMSTHREALQQLAIALGAVVDCSRGDIIRIYPPPEHPSSYITYSRKFGGTLKLEQQVTGVDVVAHRYQPTQEEQELYNEVLEAGVYEITFGSPAHSLTATGCTVQSSGANYARVSVTVPGEVIVSGKGYADNTRLVRETLQPLPAGTAQNILTVDSATLVSAANGREVARKIHKHYQHRYVNELTIIPEDEHVGDMVVVQSHRNEKLRGVIEAMEHDLTGGGRVKVRIRGERIETIDGYYVGELMAGDLVGVM